MKKIIILSIITSIFSAASAQHSHIEPCGYDKIMEQLEAQYPGFRKNYDQQFLDMIHPKVVDSRKIRVTDTINYLDTIFTIPVVFHVLWNTTAENLHDSLIINQLEVLNRDFRRLNSDTAYTRDIFKSRAGDARIQFEFATKDPNGNATNGIDRKYTAKTSFYSNQLTEMKSTANGGVDAWNTEKYLNIWVCDLSYFGQDALLGFAYPPNGHPFWSAQTWIADQNQGVVLHYKITGRNNPLANTGVLPTSKLGRVAVHEVGHYLGLRHIWGDGQAGNQCFVDDFIDDTPKQAYKSNFNCNVGVNSCTDLGTKQFPDMIENYMDYSTHTCQNMFTKEQILAMRAAINDYRYLLPSKLDIIPKQRIIDSFRFDVYKIYAAKDQTLTIEVPNGKETAGITADAYDMSGNSVFTDIILNRTETFVNTSKLAPGIYVVNIKDSANASLLKQKILITKN